MFYALLYIIAIHFLGNSYIIFESNTTSVWIFSILIYRYTYLIVEFSNYYYCNCFFEEYIIYNNNIYLWNMVKLGYEVI